MATQVPQHVLDYFKTYKGTPGNNEGAWYTDPEGYGWIGLAPQYTGGGDQGPQYAGEGVFLGGGTPTGYRRSLKPGQKASTLGSSDLFYDASGNYTHTTQNDDMGVMDNPAAMAALIAGMAFGAPYLANAAGFGGAGAAAAGTAGTMAELAGVGASVIPEGVAFTGATAAEMGAMGLGASGAGTAAMGAGSGVLDLGGGITMGADGAIMGGTGAFTPATAAEMAGMGVSAGSGGVLSSLGGAASKILGGNGGAGGFNWGSLVGPALSGLGGIAGADAAKDAANAQLQAAREAQAKLEPWYQAGGNALARLQEELGLGPNTGAANYGRSAKDFGAADFQADPGYAFRQQEQERALQRAASAAGGLGSGKFLKDAMSYSGGLASQEYGNAFNRFQTARTNRLNPLQSLAGQGQSTAQTIGDLSTQAGNAAAAGKVGRANALTNAIGQGWSMYQNSQQADQNNQLMNLLLRR